MADQEFLASFAVEIDESGVSRLQAVLEENRKLAEELAAAFTAASEAIHTLSEDLGSLPGFSGGIAEEGFSGLGGIALGLDLTEAKKDLSSFMDQLKKPVKLSANASGIVSAGRSAYESIRSLFSSPIIVTARTQVQKPGVENLGSTLLPMSTGGRFTRPTDVQVAEDGDAEYIIPVKKEDRALPLLRQLLSELSPSARQSLNAGNSGDDGTKGTVFSVYASAEQKEPSPAFREVPGISLPSAVQPTASSVNNTSNNVSAPVTINVNTSGTDASRIGQSIYDTAERYLLRTLRGAYS